jgi:excisionase family DNA binding protein
MSPTTPLLYDVDGAAEALNVSRYTIRAWLAQGKLRRVKIGSRTFVDPAELRQFVERAKQASEEKESAAAG